MSNSGESDMTIPDFFAELARTRFANRFSSLKRQLAQASLGMLFEAYIARMLFYATVGGVVVFSYSIVMLLLLGIWPVLAMLASLAVGTVAAAAIVGMFYLYPSYLIASRRKSIESALPFAINHMGALAASGVPPHTMFKLLTDAEEYGEIANEARRIVRNVEVFGMDITTAMRQTAERTPSAEFRQFLSGMIATISTGGDLRAHLRLAAKEALADYRLKRERYIASLSTYADFYVGVLIAAPLFFISILSLLAIIGGELVGLPISVILNLGIYVVLPLLNIAFILFVHMTQPSL
ncbi:MAG: type II secretion system F family protein [Candidatus Aenigmatarchaeota archaeon]